MVKRLNLRRDPVWIDVDADLRVLIRPLRRLDLARLLATAPLDASPHAVEASAANEIAAAVASGVRSRDLAVRLAIGAVEDWTVVDDVTGDRLPVTQEVGEALFGDDLALAGAFITAATAALLAPIEALEREKNASAPSPNGSSAGAPTTAAPATANARSAPRGSTSRRRSKGATSGG